MISTIIHYSEIAIKGKNRTFFENKLIDNIKKALNKDLIKVYKRYGRIICDCKKYPDNLQHIPGITFFSETIKSKPDLAQIKKDSLNLLKTKNFQTFKVIAKRSNKDFKTNSSQINNILGEHILTKLNKKVDVKNPDLKLYIEVCEKEVFIYTEKQKGIDGLPTTSSGKLISSLSGGIDSPVASFLMMKRGCKIIFVHFHNQTQQGVLTKIKDLVKELTKFQLSSKLYIVPFSKIQKQITINTPAKYRMIIYRIFMMKIINQIAKREKAKGIITGDSLGQVASQTIENINCIYNFSELPIFSPLIGTNKQEIIDLSKKIGTYDHSILPYPDCCSFMIAQHPETKADLKKIEGLEKNIENKESLIKEAISEAKVLKFSI